MRNPKYFIGSIDIQFDTKKQRLLTMVDINIPNLL